MRVCNGGCSRGSPGRRPWRTPQDEASDALQHTPCGVIQRSEVREEKKNRWPLVVSLSSFSSSFRTLPVSFSGSAAQLDLEHAEARL